MTCGENLDEVFSKLAKKEERHGKKSLTRDESVFLNTMHAYGLLGNGGLEYFFVWEDANPIVVDYFENIGMNGIADIIRRFFVLFPNVNLNNIGSKERDELLEREYPRVEMAVNSLNDEILPYLKDEFIAHTLFAKYINEKRIGISKWTGLLRLVIPRHETSTSRKPKK
jgi:hypothetical protein